jgi:co-chaperonin GroES (HSP10)
MMNNSGIYPAGNRVLILADQIDDGLNTDMIELPADVKDKYQSAVASGEVIAVGPDAFEHTTERTYRAIDGTMKLVEVSKKGYSEPFAVVGDRISFAKYAGQKYTGKDDKRYLVINDEDITCKLDIEVVLSDLRVREPAGTRVPNHSQR